MPILLIANNIFEICWISRSLTLQLIELIEFNNLLCSSVDNIFRFTPILLIANIIFEIYVF